ncbi:hypothetical protein NT05LI_0469, partial [Listeria ivanovii FSL F6-596]
MKMEKNTPIATITNKSKRLFSVRGCSPFAIGIIKKADTVIKICSAPPKL